MQKSAGNSIILLGTIALFIGAIVFGLYEKDNDNLQNKEYSSDCEYTLSDGVFTINAICIQKKKLPQLTLVDIVDRVWNQIEGFSGYYEPFSESFDYYGATPIFNNEGSVYLSEDENNELLENTIKNREKVRFSKNELAMYYAKHLSYFVANKDLSSLGNCSTTNYMLAMETLDDYVMNPGDIFNANQKLSGIKDYCKGETEEEYLFYGGVCGMVSQLFRVSLINPDITITKRFPHNEWFVQYYGETIGGDDAAVYERSKQFEIQNSGNSDIIFKVRNKGNNSELIAISWPTNKWVNISKNSINGRKLAIHLEKTVHKSIGNLDENINNIDRVEFFDSYYAGKSYESR